jgi:glutamine cyclotransferase
MKWVYRLVLLVMLSSIGSVIAQELPPGFLPAQNYHVEVLNEYPHDPTAFTQGLIWYEGSLYESTGLRGESSLREVNPTTGEVIRSIPVSRPPEQLEREDAPSDYFAEGLERIDDHLLQLTWTAGEAFLYDLETFEKLETFDYDSDGWGLCYDGRYLYMTDSSQYIAIREPETFELIGRMLVTINGQFVQTQRLNELECVGDTIYANWYTSDFIVAIDKYTGNITQVIDASGLLTEEMVREIPDTFVADDGTVRPPFGAVLNGIAYNPETETFFITGKLWPRMFEVQFVPSESGEE